MSTIKLLLCACLLAALVSSTTIERIVRPVNRRKASSSAPVKLIYINRLTSWWGDKTMPAALGVPGYTPTPLPYNYIVHTFWTYSSGSTTGSGTDAVGQWVNIIGNMNNPNIYGISDNDKLQKYFKDNFTQAGVKLLVSAFGSTQTPTSQGFDAVQCATALAGFVVKNNYDGADVDWEDTPSFTSGDSKGENWLIKFTQTLRSQLDRLGATNAIITHAPQAPYFTTNTSLYPKGAYLTVHQQVGSLIQFYNVQFYNQGVGMYDSAQGLFVQSGGWANATSIGEIIASGVPQEKVILGKPAGTADGNNGWMSGADLNSAIRNYANGWNGGIMFWQYYSDQDGSLCNTVTQGVLGPRNTKALVEA